MNASLTRPKFDAAVDASQLALSPDDRETLWRCLRAAITGKLKPDPHKPRPGWSPEAHDLREPLRREIEACRKRNSEGLMFSHIDTLEVPSPSGRNNIRASHAFDLYRASLASIQARMDETLRAGGHWRSGPVDGQPTSPEPQPIAILVANEKAAGRAAGTRDWTQWEDPRALKMFNRIFDEANKMRFSRRKWFPYRVPLSSLSERGVAADSKRASVWREAFRAALTTEIADLQCDHDRVTEIDLYDNRFEPALALWESLRDDPPLIAAIADACNTQARKHRTPRNLRFQPPRTIWHALPTQLRIELAVRFDEAARHHDEAALARGANPTTAVNPFALTDDELEKHTA